MGESLDCCILHYSNQFGNKWYATMFWKILKFTLSIFKICHVETTNVLNFKNLSPLFLKSYPLFDCGDDPSNHNHR